MIPLVVISLDRSRSRRDFMQSRLEALQVPFRFFQAIDGSGMTSAALDQAAPKGGAHYSGLLTPAEVGCALSHLGVIREIASGDDEHVAVIEDDVVLTSAALKFLDETFLKSLPPFDILQLDVCNNKKHRFSLHLGDARGHQVFALPKCNINIGGLIYARSCARAIVSSIKEVTAPIDNMIFYDQRVFGLRVIEIRPSVVLRDDGSESVIGSRPRPRGVFTKLRRESRRFHNWLRRWLGFLRAWGISTIPNLRLIRY